MRENKMMEQPERLEYLGAMLSQEQRLVLVPVDPQQPWEAFRAMRSWLRSSKKQAEVDIFESTTPIESTAEVISLESRRARRRA